MAKIYVNGDAQNVNLPLNVSELIKQLLVENPEGIVSRSRKATRSISCISWEEARDD